MVRNDMMNDKDLIESPEFLILIKGQQKLIS